MSEATPSPEEQSGLTRREFLNYAWLASLGVLMVNIGGIGFLFAMPRFQEGEFGGVFTLGRASTLPLANAPPIKIPRANSGSPALIRV